MERIIKVRNVRSRFAIGCVTSNSRVIFDELEPKIEIRDVLQPLIDYAKGKREENKSTDNEQSINISEFSGIVWNKEVNLPTSNIENHQKWNTESQQLTKFTTSIEYHIEPSTTLTANNEGEDEQSTRNTAKNNCENDRFVSETMNSRKKTGFEARESVKSSTDGNAQRQIMVSALVDDEWRPIGLYSSEEMEKEVTREYTLMEL